MRLVINARPCKTRTLMEQLDAAHRRNDANAAQEILDVIYAQFDASAAMAKSLDGATA